MTTQSPTPPAETATPAAKQEPVSQVPAGTAPAAPQAAAGDAATTQAQTAPSDDTFTSVDVKSLPPELKSKYDAMLSDYKRKTTEAAQQRKEAEQIKAQVDSVIQTPAFQQAYTQLTSKQQAEVRGDLGITEDEFNRAFESKDNFTGFVQKVARISSAQSQQEVTNLKASLALKEFKASHPDFDELNEDGMIIAQLRLDPRAASQDEGQWRAALNDAHAMAHKVQQKYIEKGKQQGLARVEQKVAASTEPPVGSVPNVFPGGDPKKITTAEAIAMARRGIRVPMT
jgi:hypothetical protein